MKKMLVVAAVLLVTAGAVFAGEMTLGVKGSLAISANKWTNKVTQENMDAMYNLPGTKKERPGAVISGGGELFFRYDFLNMQFNDKLGLSVGVQPEIGIHAGWGVREKATVSILGLTETPTIDFTYNTLDIPIMITAGLNIGKFRVNVAVGPNFGIVLGKAKMKYKLGILGSDDTNDVKVSPFIMGMQAGLGLGFNFTKNHGIVFDARGIFDFMDLKSNENDVSEPITRRTGVLLSLGYAYTF